MSRRISLLVIPPLLALALWLATRLSATAEKDSPLTLVGDGKTDNTEAIRELIRRDRTVTFPRGVFRITEPIVIDLHSTGPVALSAAGNATLLMDGPGPAIRFVGTHL